MDTQVKPQDPLIFHLTGKCQGEAVQPIAGLDLRPALLAPYRDLDALRHDFPAVLVPSDGPAFVQTLSSQIDAVLRDVAPRGIEGERLRRHALQLEREIRQAVAAGAQGTLAELWDAAAVRLGTREGETLEQVLARAGGALRADGDVVGCTRDMPARLITHAWRSARREKTRLFRADLARLVLKLSDILRAAFSHSQAGRQPQSLKAAVGGSHRDAFDFDALSRIVGKGAPHDELPAARRARLVHTLGVLEAQRFFAATDDEEESGAETYDFAFDNCAAAAQAFRERLAGVAGLVKALSIAELEAKGQYVESEHDLFFDTFDEHSLTSDDLQRFPDYLVCIPPERNDAPENAMLIELLSSGLPVKVLVQTNELLEDAAIGTGHYAFGVRSARLATTAMGLGGMFVLQTPSANLVALREQVARGLACRGPSLFSVYAGSAEPAGQLPPTLGAAAAMQSRAFPAFCYDAAAGSNWAERFSLLNNPQPEVDWPLATLDYADAALQRASLSYAFTYADFVLCDARQAAHFARVPREHWGPAMVPAADWLALPASEVANRVPYLLAVDGQDALQRVIVDARLMQATRRCVLLWRRLQEHGGVHDSHAERLLAREKAAWERAQQPAAPAAAASPAVVTATAVAATSPAPAAAEVEPAAAAHSRDEAWIETDRCPSCNECQLINDRMFTYNDRKQAYIKDLTAGSYRQLVEAAESCQVAIIHPGAPRDAAEPGLEDLLTRAEPFR
jgi:ferredoxin